MTPQNLILWIHVLCGSGWIGACLIFVLASMALGDQPEDLREFLARVTPRTNRIGIICALAVPITGMANFAFVAAKHRYHLSTAFDALVAGKIFLLAVIVLMLMRIARIGGWHTREPQSESRRLALAYGVIAGCGSVALILGLWLSGL